MKTLRKGDRGTVGFTVKAPVADGSAWVVFDGDEREFKLSASNLARATILPRKLELGMRVVRNSENGKSFQPIYEIAALDTKFAALTGGDKELIPEPPVHLSDLTPIDSDEPSDDGWIEWKGGECPVSADTLVEARLRHGAYTISKRADWFEWKHMASNSDIIAYRIVKEAE